MGQSSRGHFGCSSSNGFGLLCLDFKLQFSWFIIYPTNSIWQGLKHNHFIDLPSLPNGFLFNFHPVFQDLFVPTKIFITRRDIVYGLVITMIVVIVDPFPDPFFQLWEKVKMIQMMRIFSLAVKLRRVRRLISLTMDSGETLDFFLVVMHFS
jgi:hypothetical protein